MELGDRSGGFACISLGISGTPGGRGERGDKCKCAYLFSAYMYSRCFVNGRAPRDEFVSGCMYRRPRVSRYRF